MIAALAVLFALTAAPGPAEILHQEPYRFCHEADYPLHVDEHAWCPLVGEQNDACPTLPKACTAPPVAATGDREGRRGPGEAGDGDERTRGDAPAPRQPLTLPAGLSGLAQVVFFAMIAVGLVAVIGALARSFLRQRGQEGDEGDEGAPDPEPERSPDAEPDRRGPIETDVQRLLARAQAAASRGDYDRGLADAYAALLRRLDGDGLIEIHPCRTNGDYVRALGERPDLRAAVRTIFRDVERVQFGSEPASRAAFQSVYERVVPLVSRAVHGSRAALLCIVIAGAGVACDGGHLARLAPRGDTSPSGTRALSELLAGRQVEVRRRTKPVSQIGDDRVALVLLESAAVEPDAWAQLFSWVEDKGGVLVIAGPDAPSVWSRVRRERAPNASDATHALVVGEEFAELLGYGRLAAPGRDALVVERPGPTALLWRPHSAEAAEVGYAERARSDAEPPIYATHEQRGLGTVVVFPSGELFTNIALTVDWNGYFLASLLQSFQRPVEICDRWTGQGAASPMASMREAELTPIVLQLLALAALFLLWKGRAFGALRDPPERSRRAFADHVRALGLSYARARAAPHVSGLYAGWAIDRLRERMHRGARAGLAPLAEAIAARTGRPEREVIEALVEAHGARDAAGPPSLSGADRRPPLSGRDPSRRAASAEEAQHLALMRDLTSMLAVTSKTAARAGAVRGERPRPPAEPDTTAGGAATIAPAEERRDDETGPNAP